MFFQEATPDTSGYMIAGYAITFVILGLYVASMYLRSRNYQRDISLLEEMDEPAADNSANPTDRAARKTAKSGSKKGKK